ncbi:MAG: penicillin-binding transpeptidase domain-containing protein, partial [Pyrinomonadaceae bacterium]
MRFFFVLLGVIVFSFHVYWSIYAERQNDEFKELSYKDLRSRRLTEGSLRGWILDRSGRLDRAIALYNRDQQGRIVRSYPFDIETSQLLGSERGDAGIERALFVADRKLQPETIDLLLNHVGAQSVAKDVRLTIDINLQKAVVEQLKGRHGAVVILNPQNGEVLAIYSNPSYSLKDAQDESNWIRLEADQQNNPLVNRATRAYYIPGSTFKTVIMVAAFKANMQSEIFSGSATGFYAASGAKPIFDDNRACEICGPMNLAQAFEISSNQYFAQLAMKLGPKRLREAASSLGIGVYDKPEDALRGKLWPQIWNTSTQAVARALAPRESTIVIADRMRAYDIALEGFGQGYAGQMTPFQMALVVAAISNTEGKLMKPKIEADQPPAVYALITSPNKAEQMRRIMGLVTSGSSGTARGSFSSVIADGIT